MSDYLTSQYTTRPFRLRLVRLAWVKEHKEMESVRDPNVALPDCRQVWEAPSQYLFYCWTLNPPSFPQPGGSRRYFRWLSNQLNPLVGWYLTILLVEARWDSIHSDPDRNSQDHVNFISLLPDHTSLNLTSPIRSDLVRLCQVT